MSEEWAVVASQKQRELPMTGYVRLSETVKASLIAMGLQIHPSSRLAKYDRSLASLLRTRLTSSSADDETLRVAARAFTELWQLAAIAHYAQTSGADREFRDKTRTLMQDAALPANEPAAASTPGRDVQFELFVAASWSAGGVPCMLRQPPGPDLTLTLGSFDVGLEVKCIKSIASLADRLQKADKQISLLSSGGVVMTDLSPVVTNNLLYMTASSARKAVPDLERRLKTLMFSHLDTARRKVRPARTFGWIGYCQALYLCADAPPLLVYQWKNLNLGSGRDHRWLSLVAALPRLVVGPEAVLSSLSISSVNLDRRIAR